MFMRQVVMLLLVVCIGIFIGSMIGYSMSQPGQDELNRLLNERGPEERRATERASEAQALIEANVKLRQQERFVRWTLEPNGAPQSADERVNNWLEIAQPWQARRQRIMRRIIEWLRTTHKIDVLALDPDRDLNVTSEQFAAMKEAMSVTLPNQR